MPLDQRVVGQPMSSFNRSLRDQLKARLPGQCGVVLGEVSKRPGLSGHERSIVTLAALGYAPSDD
jgi:alkylhydroperoxidase/carboxymuconolactone decarboxylase family protein YurZ